MVDHDRLMDAIAQVETSGGRNSYPRFEAAYAPAGSAFTIQGRIVRGTGACWNDLVSQRWQKWGMASACSFGKHQLLYHTAADLGFKDYPWALWQDEVADLWVRARLIRIGQRIPPGTSDDDALVMYADAWNSGSFKDKIVPIAYIDAVKRAYNAP